MPYSVRPYGLQPARLLCPWNSPGKNTGVGCHSLLQGIFPTQGSGEGERVLALESREGTRASRRVEEGLSRSLSGRSRAWAQSWSSAALAARSVLPTLRSPAEGEGHEGFPPPPTMTSRVLLQRVSRP